MDLLDMFTITLCIYVISFGTVSTDSQVCAPNKPVGDEDSDVGATRDDIQLKPIRKKGICSDLMNVMTYTNKHVNSGASIPISCGNCFIYNVTATATGSEACRGMTSEVKSSSMNCRWKSQCKVTYLPSIILHPLKHSCFGTPTEGIALTYTCLPKSIPMYDVIPKTEIIQQNSGYIQTFEDESEIPLISDSFFNLPNKNDSPQVRIFQLNLKSPEESCHQFTIKVLDGKFTTGHRWYFELENEFCDIIENTVSVPDTSYVIFKLHLHKVTKLEKMKFKFEWSGCPNGKKENKTAESTYYMIKSVNSISSQGIIRSHENYPWNYPRPIGADSRPLWTSFYHYLKRPVKELTVLKLQFEALDIEANDRLNFTFSKGKQETVVTADKLKPYYTDFEAVKITFKVRNSRENYIPSTSGFLLFYEWSTNKTDLVLNYILKANMCKKDQVPQKCAGSVVTKKPKTKKTTKQPNNNNTTAKRTQTNRKKKMNKKNKVNIHI